MRELYCNNCESEATYYYMTDGGVPFLLCYTCSEAFELGQVNPDASVLDVDELDVDIPEEDM